MFRLAHGSIISWTRPSMRIRRCMTRCCGRRSNAASNPICCRPNTASLSWPQSPRRRARPNHAAGGLEPVRHQRHYAGCRPSDDPERRVAVHAAYGAGDRHLVRVSTIRDVAAGSAGRLNPTAVKATPSKRSRDEPMKMAARIGDGHRLPIGCCAGPVVSGPCLPTNRSAAACAASPCNGSSTR